MNVNSLEYARSRGKERESWDMASEADRLSSSEDRQEECVVDVPFRFYDLTRSLLSLEWSFGFGHCTENDFLILNQARVW